MKIQLAGKKHVLVAPVAMLCALQVQAAEVAGIDLYGYMRGGFQSSGGAATPRGGYTLGGDVHNYRLGNEGDYVLEFGMSKNFEVPNVGTFGAYYMPTIFNGTNGTAEGYVTFSGLSFAPEVEFWAGQRRLRIQDVHIVNNFFADYGDNIGAGFTGLKLGNFAKLGASVFTGDSIDNKVSDPDRARRLSVDLSGIQTNPGGSLRLTTTFVNGNFAYGSNGAALSLLHNQQDFLAAGLKHSLFVQAANGHADLSGKFFGLSTSSTGLVVDPATGAVRSVTSTVPTPGHKAWRIVDSVTWQVGRFGGQTMAGYQHSKSDGGPSDGVVTKDASLGARVAYAVTDYFKMQAEAGTTSRSVDGSSTQRLHKVTIAPTLAMGGDFWSRPELRLYATHVRRNDAAVAANAGGFNPGAKSATLFGVQVEAWWK
jgi:maltoporin